MTSDAIKLDPGQGDGKTVGPLTDMAGAVERASNIAWEIIAANVPQDLHWEIVLLTLTIATLIWRIRNGHGSKGVDGRVRKTSLSQFLLPKDILTHVSARVDIWLWVIERGLRPVWAVGLLSTVGPTVERTMIRWMEASFGATPALQANYAWMLLYSLVLLLSYDLVFYLTHYAMHKVPALWAIHKIHHSAEVLTPLTRTREHFLAGPIWASGQAFSYGVGGGLFAYLFDGGITEATLLNLGFFAVLTGFNGSFRHYHVQFRYPRWLEKWLQSPTMHHIHHSYLPQHWDRNFAAVTSIWDRIFGTIYIPEKDEYTPWGIGPETQDDYRSVWQNTIGPFRDWSRMLGGGMSRYARLGIRNQDR
jgi:sterol desaturase/sphingolipid hydroxylase (fatty acid hydroxylase superfamily)